MDDGKLLPEHQANATRDLLPNNTKVFVSRHRWQRIVWHIVASCVTTFVFFALLTLADGFPTAIPWVVLAVHGVAFAVTRGGADKQAARRRPRIAVAPGRVALVEDLR